MANKYKYSALFMFLVINFACTKQPTTSPEAEAYLKEILQIMQNKSINKKTLNWASISTQVLDNAKGAQSIQETYQTIKLALTFLQDRHSGYYTSYGAYFQGYTPITCFDRFATKPVLPSEIGYVKVSAFLGTNDEALTYAQNLQNTIRFADNDSIKSWIVDLRGNTGGNMWPMLAGIGPILGEGIVGYFIDPDDNATAWSYKDGSAAVEGNNIVTVKNPYKLLKSIGIMADHLLPKKSKTNSFDTNESPIIKGNVSNAMY